MEGFIGSARGRKEATVRDAFGEGLKAAFNEGGNRDVKPVSLRIRSRCQNFLDVSKNGSEIVKNGSVFAKNGPD
jgi:hypothetical protein